MSRLHWMAGLLSLAAAGSVPAQTDDVVAKFGAVELRASELRRLIEAQEPGARAQLLASPQALDRLVRTEAFRRALAAEARASGFDKRPEVAARLERAREQALVESYVNSLARPPAEFPSESDLKTAYESAKSELVTPRRWRVAQIFVAGAGVESEKKAADLARRARAAAADFGALARQHSEHPESARNNGDMGWIAEGETLAEVARALAGLKPGEVSEPVRSQGGYHVLRLSEVRAPEPRALEEVKPQLAAALRARRAQELESRYFDELLAKNPIAVNEVSLVRLRDELAARKP